MKSLEKDILLICKGWYSDQYENILDAFNAYYHREYGCKDITMDKRFALELFLKPTIIEISKYNIRIIRELFNPTCIEIDDNFSVTFTNVMYERCISALSSMPTHDKVDLSDYAEMLNSIRREVADWNIGII